MFLCCRKDVSKQEYGDVSSSFHQTQSHYFRAHVDIVTSRLNTFLELKMENELLQHRVRELRAQKVPFLQTPSSSTTLNSNYGGMTSSTPSSTVPDHSESGSGSTNPNPATRNFDAAGLQEGDQDEPAKKKVRHNRYSDETSIITQDRTF